MTVNGFGVEEQREIFRILAAVLSLGNLQFGQDDKELTVIKNKGEIDLIAGLLSVPSAALEHAMTHQLIKTGKEAISKPNTVANAEFTRDTLAKTLYVRLFRHIVASINSALALRKSRLEEDDEYGDGGETREPPSVGVLDIFGFEVVAVRLLL